MSVNYINRQLTEEEFFKLVFEKGKSLSSEKKARSGVNNLEYFTQDKYKKSRFVVLKDLKEDLDKTHNADLVIRFFQQFIDWMGQDHSEIRFYTHHNHINGRPKPKKNISRVKSELKAIIRGHVRDTDIAKLAEPDFEKVYSWLEYLTPKNSSNYKI